MIERIVITGAESTGKSSLSQSLATDYNAPMSSEFVRSYVDSVKRPLTAADLEPIARGQIAEEERALKAANQIVFHDTNILSSIIYAEHFFGQHVSFADQHFRNRHYSLYLLCLPDIPWVADEGQRESPETREKFHRIFKTALIDAQLPFVEIGGDFESRLQDAKTAIARFSIA